MTWIISHHAPTTHKGRSTTRMPRYLWSMERSRRQLSIALKMDSNSLFTREQSLLITEKGRLLGDRLQFTIYPPLSAEAKTLPLFCRVFWQILSYRSTIMLMDSSSCQSSLLLKTIPMLKMRCLSTTRLHCKAIHKFPWAVDILQLLQEDQGWQILITFPAWLENNQGLKAVHNNNLVEVFLPPSKAWTNISTIRPAQQLWLRRSPNCNLILKKEETLRTLWLSNSD